MNQKKLFDFETDPKTLHRREGPATSIEAAYALDVTEREIQALTAIASFGSAGCISDQVREYCGTVFQTQYYSSVTARWKALEEKGLIERTGDKRPGASSRQQMVMRITTTGLIRLTTD